jgi:hypothetical protein
MMLIFGIFFTFFYYILYTLPYYRFCNYAKLKNDLIIVETKQIYSDLCNSTFKEYSNHSIMKYSINSIYSLISKTELSNEEREDLANFVHNTPISKMRKDLYILKFVFLSFYLIMLYYLVLKLPRILINILLFFIDKLLVFIFFIRVVEVLLNMYMDINLDLIEVYKWLYNYIHIPFN